MDEILTHSNRRPTFYLANDRRYPDCRRPIISDIVTCARSTTRTHTCTQTHTQCRRHPPRDPPVCAQRRRQYYVILILTAHWVKVSMTRMKQHKGMARLFSFVSGTYIYRRPIGSACSHVETTAALLKTIYLLKYSPFPQSLSPSKQVGELGWEICGQFRIQKWRTEIAVLIRSYNFAVLLLPVARLSGALSLRLT